MAKAKCSAVFTWIIFASFSIGLCQEDALKIVSLEVPEVIQEGETDSIVLDCEYTVQQSNGLVLKWFFTPENSKSAPKHIYQWIIDKKYPQAIGAFKNSININYSASDDPIYKYRALNILRPSRNMSGTYQCTVETYTEGPAKSSAKMIVFVPPKALQFSQDKNDDGTIEVSCTANDVYPAPELNIRVGDKLLTDIEVNRTQESDLLYDIRVEADLNVNHDLPDDPTKVFCELALPGANYAIKQEGLVYQAGMPTMVPKSAASANLAASSSRNGKLANSATLLVPCLQFLMALYCGFLIM